MNAEYRVITKVRADEISWRLEQIEASQEITSTQQAWLAEMLAYLPYAPAAVEDIIRLLPRVSNLFRESQKQKL